MAAAGNFRRSSRSRWNLWPPDLTFRQVVLPESGIFLYAQLERVFPRHVPSLRAGTFQADSVAAGIGSHGRTILARKVNIRARILDVDADTPTGLSRSIA